MCSRQKRCKSLAATPVSSGCGQMRWLAFGRHRATVALVVAVDALSTRQAQFFAAVTKSRRRTARAAKLDRTTLLSQTTANRTCTPPLLQHNTRENHCCAYPFDAADARPFLPFAAVAQQGLHMCMQCVGFGRCCVRTQHARSHHRGRKRAPCTRASLQVPASLFLHMAAPSVASL